MSKENYKVEEIIMGLRSVYKEEREALAKLKKCVSVTDKRVKDYNFKLYKESYNPNPDLQLSFKIKETKFQEMLYEFLVKLGWVPQLIDRDTSKVLRGFNEDFALSGYFSTYIQDKQRFNEIVRALMASEFVRNISRKLQTPNTEIDISHSTINTSMIDKNSLRGSLWYYAQDDMLILIQFADSSLVLPDALDLKIPTNDFTEYHTSHIDTYLESPKGVIIEDTMASSKSAFYKIIEEEDAIILRRTK